MWLYAEIKTLADIPRYYARKTGDKKALILGDRSKTFRELDLISNRVANAIIAGGIQPRAHVSFIGKNSFQFFEVLFGATKAGCAMSPLNWRLTAHELAEVIDDSQTPLIVVDREYRELMNDVKARTTSKFATVEFDSTSTEPSEYDARLAQAGDTDPKVAIQPQDTALLLYTSGTTGKPKGVQITHEGLYYQRLCEHLEPAYNWLPNDVMMLVMPNFHLVGTGLSIQGIYNGATISMLPAMDVPKLLETIERDHPTICCLVPTAIQMMVDHPKAKETDFSSLRLIMYAGSSIGMELLKRAIKQTGCKFMQFYGATESSGAVTLLRPEQHDLNSEQKLKSCGTPLPLMEIKIVDANGNEVEPGQIGEFYIKSPTLFKGYWGQPETTAAALKDGWYHAGDAGYRDADGLHYIVDRVKDMIITGGENVYSTEVEQALCKHPAVGQAAVVGVPDERWGEKVTALVILATGQSATEEELIAHCRELIAGYKVPKMIKFLSSFPMTPSGKVLKRDLREQLASGG
ncbi:MAG: long-chain-fatty-acid--CoA ligase [Rhodocyclaceae bacterium]|nr:long-chain-fatty-acid--CoA ligase [Rhodocyclaceae bacterium]